MKKQDRILLLSFAGIALLMLGIFFIMEHLQGPQAYALISVDGNNVREIEPHCTDQQINLSEYGAKVVLEISDHRIRFLSSDCPDHLCIGFGWLDHQPQSAVCMPNRVAVTINNQPTLFCRIKNRTPTDATTGRRLLSACPGNGYPLKSSNREKHIILSAFSDRKILDCSHQRDLILLHIIQHL